MNWIVIYIICLMHIHQTKTTEKVYSYGIEEKQDIKESK